MPDVPVPTVEITEHGDGWTVEVAIAGHPVVGLIYEPANTTDPTLVVWNPTNIDDAHNLHLGAIVASHLDGPTEP
jgi:hypothetical protein